jgi:hypothetical protein
MDLEKRGENYVLHVSANRKETDPSAAPRSSREGGFLTNIAERLWRPRNSDEAPSEHVYFQQKLCYTPSDISRLTAEQQAQHGGASVMPNAYRLSQLLRVVGDYLDRKNAQVFDVSLSGQTLCIRYQSAVGEEIHETFNTRNLYDLAIHMYLRRSQRLENSA